jgi:hypothetical protein
MDDEVSDDRAGQFVEESSMTDRQSQMREELDAKVCYLLSRRQGIPFIAVIMSKTEDEVRRLAELGASLLDEASRRKPKDS